MSELCLLLIYSLKVVIVVAIVWLMGWGGLGAFRWWQKYEDDEFWGMWKKWFIISGIAFVVILILSGLTPITVCRPPDVIDIPFYGQ